jgi:hypothetical protein
MPIIGWGMRLNGVVLAIGAVLRLRAGRNAKLSPGLSDTAASDHDAVARGLPTMKNCVSRLAQCRMDDDVRDVAFRT